MQRIPAALSRLIAVAGLGVAVVLPLTGSAPAGPLVDCGWSKRIGADTLNAALPDTFANYWMAAVLDLPPEGITVRGEFPHGRYISFTSYRGSRTMDGLDDLRIHPDPGSVNPFRPDADRTAAARSYTVHVKPGPRPAEPAPNTLYADPGLAVFIYRVYRPDEGLGPQGGVALPELTVQRAAGAQRLPACDASRDVSRTEPAPLPSDPLPIGLPAPEFRTWSKTSGDGVFANPDNTYLLSHVAPEPGEVAVIRAKLPSTPATYRDEPRMGAGQLRYWSMCANEVVSTRVSACVVDDQTAVDESGYFTIVVSAPEDRPANATADCAVGWLPTTRVATLLLMRNMLPASDFAQSIQSAREDDPAGSMGEFYPRTEIRTAADFETTGCAGPGRR